MKFLGNGLQPLKFVTLALNFIHEMRGVCTVSLLSDCDYCGQFFLYEDRKLFCSTQCQHDYAGATNGAKRFNLTVEKKAAWEKKKFEEAV
jgi:hypothetical protein